MTTNPSISTIMENCRIPDRIRFLPTFDGEQSELYKFINNVDDIVTDIYPLIAVEYQRIFTSAIKNKIIGHANSILSQNENTNDWKIIRKILLDQYADKRDETTLLLELTKMSQHNKSPEQFYSQINEILSTIINNIKLQTLSSEIISHKILSYKNIALETFLIGLHDSLSLIVRSQQPSTLKEAWTLVQKEQNLKYKQQLTKAIPNQKPFNTFNKDPISNTKNNFGPNHNSKIYNPNTNPLTQKPTHNYSPFQQNPSRFNSHTQWINYRPPQFGQHPSLQYRRQNPQNPTFYRPQNPTFYRPQNPSFSKPQNSNLPSTSMQRNNNYQPEPMDTSSGHTGRNTIHQNTLQPTFKSKELFNFDPHNSYQEQNLYNEEDTTYDETNYFQHDDSQFDQNNITDEIVDNDEDQNLNFPKTASSDVHNM